MCAIFGIFDCKKDPDSMRSLARDLAKRMRHRGPDWSGIYVGPSAVLAHERLSIVDVEHGEQPLYNKAGTHALAVNGEIYNHEDLREGLSTDYAFQTRSDCEIILALYAEKGDAFVDELRGMFAFALYDAENGTYLIARDHMGIIPLFTGYDGEGNFYVASEMKALTPVCTRIKPFPPGHLLVSGEEKPRPYYHRPWRSFEAVAEARTDRDKLRTALERSVKSHLMSDVPYGVLLSGGLDSSIVAAVAKKYADKRVEEHDKTAAWWPRLHSFAIGLEGSPDLEAAATVGKAIDTVHHSLHFTLQDGLDALSDVIYHIETYDVTTVRASTPCS